MTDEHIVSLANIFKHITLEKDQVLFEAGVDDDTFYLLMSGEIALSEEGEVKFLLHAPAPIGELGALTGLRRNTTASATKQSEVWQVDRGTLLAFFEEQGDVAFPFYHNFVHVLADKVRLDERRMEEMRRNIIRTQKAMKRMRDLILESPETPISEELHDTLDDLIRQNRRANYSVEPPAALPAMVRLDTGETVDVVEISRTHFWMHAGNGHPPEDESHWSGILVLPTGEIPVSGMVLRAGAGMVEVKLDLLIDESQLALEDYVTRVQMLDFVV
jgi:CRP-like cAMP-binding protein